MSFLTDWFRNLSLEDLLRWVRQLFQFLSGSGVAIGVIGGEKWVTIGAIIASVVTFLWQLKANTIASKVTEVKKSPDVISVKPSVSAPVAVKDAAAS
jgi:hypothetical protein